MPTHYKPEGFHNVTPYLTIRDVAKLLEFLKKTFAIKVDEPLKSPDGRIMHAQVKIADSTVMLGEAQPGMDTHTGQLYVYVEDVDATYKRALAAGAKSFKAPTNEFWGDRRAGVTDFAGNMWWFAAVVEQITMEEMKRRAADFAKKMATR
jgi:PhnB protein